MLNLEKFEKRSLNKKTGEIKKTDIWLDLTQIVYIEKIDEKVTKIHFAACQSVEVLKEFEIVITLWENACCRDKNVT